MRRNQLLTPPHFLTNLEHWVGAPFFLSDLHGLQGLPLCSEGFLILGPLPWLTTETQTCKHTTVDQGRIRNRVRGSVSPSYILLLWEKTTGQPMKGQRVSGCCGMLSCRLKYWLCHCVSNPDPRTGFTLALF